MFHNEKLLDSSHQNLNRYNNKDDAFFDRIITGYDTWIHHYERESKRHILNHRPTKRSRASAENFCQQLSRTRYFNNKQYSLEWSVYLLAKICNLKQTSRNTGKRRCALAWQIPSAFFRQTVETLQKLKIMVLPYTPYRPNLASSDNHLFGALKRYSEAVDPSQTKNWRSSACVAPNVFSDVINQLVYLWDTCLKSKESML